jgi:hypothetical protein
MADSQVATATPAAAPASSVRATLRRAVLLDGAWLALQGCAVLAIAFFGLGGFDRNFRIPFDFSGDTLVFLSQAKGTIDNGWWWSNPLIGAPFTLPALLFPSNTNVDQAIVGVLGLLIQDVSLNVNLAWLGILMLGGFSATFCLRSLGASRPAGFIGGLLFAISPYAVYRGLGHFSLVVYLMPFPAALALHLASGLRRLPPGRTVRLVLLGGCALQAFDYTYYAFFGCFFIVVGSAAGWWMTRDRAVLRLGALGLVVTVACVAANLAPSVYVAHRDGEPLVVRDKAPAEAEVYGLKIRQLVSPIFRHPFPPLRAWGDKDAAAQFPLETENMVSRLGTIASVGFLALLGIVLVGTAAPRRPDAVLLGAGQLTIAAILLGTIGGFGSLFNLLVAPEIRAYNRICPFILFFALVAVCAGIDRAIRARRAAGLALAGLVLAVGVWEQATPFRSIASVYDRIRADYLPLQQFVARLEELTPDRSMVLQLPFTMYLNDSGHVRMGPYDSFKPYLVSHHLRWSYPALSNQQMAWQEGAAQLPGDRLVQYAAEEGFATILVDRYGYADGGAGVGAAIAGVPDVATLLDGDRYVAYDISRVATPAWLTGEKRRELRTDAPVTPGLSACQGAPLLSLDKVGRAVAPSGSTVEVSRSADVGISGWAVAPANAPSGADVEIEIDGLVRPALYGFDRPDVAAYLNRPDAQASGFRLTVPADVLPPGSHPVTLRLLASDAQCYYQAQVVTLHVR